MKNSLELYNKKILEEKKKWKKKMKNLYLIQDHIDKKVPKLLKRKAKFYRYLTIDINFYPIIPLPLVDFRNGVEVSYVFRNIDNISEHIYLPHNLHYRFINTEVKSHIKIIENNISYKDNGKIDFSSLNEEIENIINNILDIPKKDRKLK